jgi:predicted kinase
MVIFINGSFGIGKTTVSRLLVQRLPHSVLFDPEPVGLATLRLSSVWPSRTRVDDFQDLAIWRAMSIRLLGLVCRLRRVVVVPMAFSNAAYLGEFLRAARRRGETFHFCLTAPLAVVRERLSSREAGRVPTAWQLRRSEECCQAHQRPEFGEAVPTEGRSPQAVAHEILERISRRAKAGEPASERLEALRSWPKW